MKNNQDAIKLLRQKLKEINLLQDSRPFSAEHTKWLTNTLYLLEEIFGQESRIYLALVTLSWRPTGSYPVRDVFNADEEVERITMRAYRSALDTAGGILQSAIEQIERKGLEGVYEGKNTAAESSDIVKIISLLQNKLRKVVRVTPMKEKEIQDAVESLFVGADLDGKYTREKEHLVYSSKTYIPDFVFKKIDTVVEIKLCDSLPRVKEIIGEINDDILAYKTKYANIIFIVYDKGIIRDSDEFKGSFETHEHVVITVVKH